MRACEGCRKRKIKCDAVTTNSWPCSACIRLKLPCVKPNGFDGAMDGNTYDGSMGADQYNQTQTQPGIAHSDARSGPHMYGAYSDHSASGYQGITYDHSQVQAQGLQYTSMHPHHSALEQQYVAQNVFPTPPLQHHATEPSPEAYSPDSFAQHDLSELLGNLKVDEKGTGESSHTGECAPQLLTDIRSPIFTQ
jgi:Fungal Zn(2)-Cys(6) binuclear cluster domain